MELNNTNLGEISYSDGGKYEDGCLFWMLRRVVW